MGSPDPEGVETSGGLRWFLLGTGHGVPCEPLGGGVVGRALVAAPLMASKRLEEVTSQSCGLAAPP